MDAGLRCPRCSTRLIVPPVHELLPVCPRCKTRLGYDELETARRRARYADMTAADLAQVYRERALVAVEALDELMAAIDGGTVERWPETAVRHAGEALAALTDVRAAWQSAAFTESPTGQARLDAVAAS